MSLSLKPREKTPELLMVSRFYEKVQRRYSTWLQRAEPLGWRELQSADSMAQWLHELQTEFPAHHAALRVLRQVWVAQIMRLDLSQTNPTAQPDTLAEVMRSMTALAEFAIQHAQRQAQSALAQEGHAARPAAELLVVGMGKLGSGELNVSSDVDLIAFYDDAPAAKTSAHDTPQLEPHSLTAGEYWFKVVQRMTQILEQRTEHGQVFRVDWALRPNGSEGQLVQPRGSLAHYLLSRARPWERFAWLKGRVLNAQHLAPHALQTLQSRVQPFVFRSYQDPSLRSAIAEVRAHIHAALAGGSGLAAKTRRWNVKLGSGGIREIEFFTQLHQILRGGEFAELRVKDTQSALRELAQLRHIRPESAAQLNAAYVFLRHLEHRIQYLDDLQTHDLPSSPDLAWVAQCMGFDDVTAFEQALAQHQTAVQTAFDSTVAVAVAVTTAVQNESALLAASVAHVPAGQVAAEPALSANSHSVEASSPVELAYQNWLQTLKGRPHYVRQLEQTPQLPQRVRTVFARSDWARRYLTAHPMLLDELAQAEPLTRGLTETQVAEVFDAPAFSQQLEARRSALAQAGQDDEEALLNVLRSAHHRALFAILWRDISGRLPVAHVADALSLLADAVLIAACRWAWALLCQKPGFAVGDKVGSPEPKQERSPEQLPAPQLPAPQIALIAYGKLGGKELGYGSDLDLVFLYDDAREDAAPRYAQLVRKLIFWLTAKTQLGAVYDIDTALRPNGQAGLLVSSVDEFERYQLRQSGSANAAWLWETQALTRARCVWGWGSLAARFEALRSQVLCQSRPEAALATEIVAMRQKLRSAYDKNLNKFDPKHSTGGMLDVEFAVQYLVLRHSAQHPQLTQNLGNMALLLRAEGLHLLPSGIGQAAASAYETLRLAQHAQRLEAPGAGDLSRSAEVQTARQAVQALWQQVFVPHAMPVG